MPKENFHYDLDPDDDYRPGPAALLESSKTLLSINKGERDPDERDALYFGRVYTPAKLLAERISLDADKSIRATMRRVNMRRSLQPVSANQFGGLIEKFITSHQLSMPLEEINPTHVLEQNRRVTRMGPGGILSSDSVSEDASNVHTSIFGFLSMLEGPESELYGVDTRIAYGARLGSDGRLYQKFRDSRSGKMKWLSPKDLVGKTMAVEP